MTCDKCGCGPAIERLAEAVSILLEHAGSMDVAMSPPEQRAGNRAVSDALTLVKGEA